MAKAKGHGRGGRPPKGVGRSRESRPLSAAQRHQEVERLEILHREQPDNLAVALDLAERYNQTDRERQIVDLLTPFESRYPFDDTVTAARYDRMLAFGYAHQKWFTPAERVALRGRQLLPDCGDFWFTLTYVSLGLREFGAAIEQARQYLTLARQPAQCDGLPAICIGRAFEASVLNLLAVALQETGVFDQAEAAFREAITTDPESHLAYINLANLLNRLRRTADARTVVERGLKKCRQVSELRLLLTAATERQTISACLMVRNEEEMLPDCLKSLRDWVDEIIVVDTGSSDQTVAIAESYGAKVYHHPWENDFSKSRNFTLQYATCDWVFVIDADERVYPEDVPQIVRYTGQQDFDVLAAHVYNVYPEQEDVLVYLPSNRFFRRKLGLRYEGIVHNQLAIPQQTRILRTGIRIKHYGYGLSREKMRAKKARTRALLEKQLAETPDNAFAHFNYAQVLRAGEESFPLEHADLILRSAGRAAELTDPGNPRERDIHLMALDQLSWTHYHLKNYDESIQFAERALDLKPNYLDQLMCLAYAWYGKREYGRAEEYFTRYLSVRAHYREAEETDSLILLHLGSSIDAHFNLGALAELQQKLPEAKRHYEAALQLNPRHRWANNNLARVLLLQHDYLNAQRYLEQRVQLGDPTAETLGNLARCYALQQRVEDAEGYFRQALSLTPDDTALKSDYTRFQIETVAERCSAHDLEQLLANPEVSAQSLTLVAEKLARNGDHRSAVDVYTKTIDRFGPTPERLNDLANCYYRLGQFAQAESSYRQALAANPAMASAHRNLGMTLIRLNQPAAAIDSLQRYLDSAPADESDIWHLIADQYLKVDDPTTALAYYEQYLRTNTRDVGALLKLSDCYQRLGHQRSAVLGYERVLAIDPDHPAARRRLQDLAGQPSR